MGRVSDLVYLLRGTASQIIELGAPQHRGKRVERLGQRVARLLAEGRRLVMRNSEVVVVSWPKAGRTWLRYMLDQLGLHLEYTHQRESQPLPDGWQRKRIIFLHRDPRDTTISHWFAAVRRGGGYRGSLSDFLRDPESGLERTMRFNLFWRERLARDGNGLTLTYEGLHADTAGELGRAVSFLRDRNVSEKALGRAVAAGRFENMRAIEKSGRGAALYGDVLAPGDPADPDSFKTREGRTGGWRMHFSSSDAAFADALLARHDYLRRMAPLSISAPS